MRLRDRCAAVLAAITIGVALAALGGALRWGACMAAALALATALVYLPSRRLVGRHSPLVWALGLAIGLTTVQLLPLPVALVAWLAPIRYQLAVDTAAALGMAAPTWVALSYDPSATLLELAKLIGYVAFALAGARLAASARGCRWLAGTCAAAGAALAVCGLAHRGVDAQTLLGIYQPRALPTYIAPLLNENHFAGFLALAAPLALALAVASTGVARLLWVGAVAICTATNVLLASRGGTIALVVGLIVAVGLLLVQRQWLRRRNRSWSVWIPAGVVAACALVLLVTLAAQGIRAELAQTSMAELDDPNSKLGVWRAATALAAENPWTGVGRGGFEAAFTRFHHSGTKTYSHAENEYVQAVVDWGVPGAGALLLMLAWAAVGAAQTWRAGAVQAGALAAIAATGVHSSADFHLQMPGVALAVIAVLSIVLPARLGPGQGQRRSRLIVCAGGALVGAGVIGLAASPAGRSARDAEVLLATAVTAAVKGAPAVATDAVTVDPGRAAAAATGGPGLEADSEAADAAAIGAERAAAAAATTAAGRAHPAAIPTHRAVPTSAAAGRAVVLGEALLQRYPADYLIAGLLAQACIYARDPRAVAVVNRALSLNPKHAGLRVLAAHVLLRAGYRGQALIEYALALRYTMTPGDLLADLVRWFPEPTQAARGIPAYPDRIAVMTNRLVTLNRSDVAYAYARRVYEQYPDDWDTQRIVADLAVRQGDIPVAIAAGTPAYERGRGVPEAVTLGRALRLAGRLDAARTVLEDAVVIGRHGDPRQLVRVHQTLAEVHSDRGDLAAAKATLRTAVDLAQNSSRRVRARLHRQLARIEERLGNRDLAAEERARADELAPP